MTRQKVLRIRWWIILGAFSGHNAVQEMIGAVSQRVTLEMNEVLLQPYSVEEIKVAVFQIHTSKCPGQDGMSPLFYQQFWHIVGPEMVEVVRSFLQSGYLSKEVCFTHVVLVPKVNKPQDMSQLRSISLCNVLYKIGATVIANHLKGMMSTIILTNQSAFVPGRLISDNSLMVGRVALHLSLISVKLMIE